MLDLHLDVAVVTHPLDVESAEHPRVLLDPIAAQFGGSEPIEPCMIRSGYPAGALADFADELPAAIVAINSRSRRGFARVALGSVTMGVLQLASCPLLVTHHLAEAAE